MIGQAEIAARAFTLEMMRAAIAVAVFATRLQAADACARMDPEDLPLTPDGAVVASDGGVIMTIGYAFGRSPLPLTLRTVGSKTPPVIRSIAPQLSVLQPAPGHAVELVDGNGKVVRTFTIAAVKAPALAAPKLAALTSTAAKPVASTTPTPRIMGVPNTNLAITLADPPPADAFALVIYAGSDQHAWVGVTANQTTYAIATGGKGCHGANAFPTYQGEALRFAWLDRGGRLSALSAVVRVGVAK